MRPTRQDFVSGFWVIAITALLFLPLPVEATARRWPQLVRDLTNFGHPLAFAWLAHVVIGSLLLRWPRERWKAYAWVLAGAATYGAATELIQGLVNRQPSLQDFSNDMLGAAFTLLLHGGAELRSRRRMQLALGSMAIACAVVAAFPLGFTLVAYLHRELREPVLWQEHSALFAHFSRWESKGRLALVITEPLPDWRAYRYLELEVLNPGPGDHPIIVRVHDIHHDQRHEDRFNQRYMLPPHLHETLRIPLEEIRSAPEGRELDLGAIRGTVIFSATRDAGSGFEVKRIRLTR